MSNLNQEEDEIVKSYDSDEWNSVDGVESEKDRLKILAKSTLQKNKRINIRLSESDLNRIRIKALEEGIPYQTFISSILHKFVTGRLESK
ncbi:MAG: antitoxin [Cytophagales bacterium]|nr:antitoxin [Cytophagales bacterium]